MYQVSDSFCMEADKYATALIEDWEVKNRCPGFVIVDNKLPLSLGGQARVNFPLQHNSITYAVTRKNHQSIKYQPSVNTIEHRIKVVSSSSNAHT
jgi:hypothetical protein